MMFKCMANLYEFILSGHSVKNYVFVTPKSVYIQYNQNILPNCYICIFYDKHKIFS